jgi:hypothetical protein
MGVGLSVRKECCWESGERQMGDEETACRGRRSLWAVGVSAATMARCWPSEGDIQARNRSPLSQQHSFRTDSPTPIHIASGPSNVSSHSPGIALSPRRLSTSRSLAGSYTLSLLSSRMSAAHPTHHVPSAFTLKIGSVSTVPDPRRPRRCACTLKLMPPCIKRNLDVLWTGIGISGDSRRSSGRVHSVHSV